MQCTKISAIKKYRIKNKLVKDLGAKGNESKKEQRKAGVP
jgi:hypothetical protein